jgi:predicted MFS family arabinose efflux permease
LQQLDALQRQTLVWAGFAVVLTAFDGSVLVLALPAIASDFHARVPALSNLGSVLALGALGALPLATLADRFGRRRLIAVGVGGFSIANFASALAPSLEALAVLRLIAVCFEVLVGGVATALIVEEAPPGRRGQAVSVLAVLSGAGTGITVLAYPVVAPHWRWLFLAGGIGLVAAPLIWRMLPEGRVWQRAHFSGSALRLLLQPPWRRRLIVIGTTTALLAVLLEPAGLLFTLFASEVLRLSPVAISELIVVSGLAGAASYIAGGFLTDRFGRRRPATELCNRDAGFPRRQRAVELVRKRRDPCAGGVVRGALPHAREGDGGVGELVRSRSRQRRGAAGRRRSFAVGRPRPRAGASRDRRPGRGRSAAPPARDTRRRPPGLDA